MLKEFATSAGDELQWRQPKAVQRAYELYRRDDLFGTLEFRSLLGTLARSSDPIQPWSFKRLGFLNPHITIRFPEAESDYALFFPKLFGGGSLHLPDGRPFSWEPVNFWRTHWRFIGRGGFPILAFDQGSQEFKLTDVFKLQAAVKVESSRITNLEFSLLVNLGFYLMVLHQADTAAAASAGSSS